MKKFWFCLWAAAVLVGCKGTNERTLTSATGSIYECLIVMDNDDWAGELGDSVRACLGADMPCLPQMEPYFKLSQVDKAHFDNLFKPSRNILFLDTDSVRYSQAKVLYSQNVFSKPQAMCRLQAPTKAQMLSTFCQYGERIRAYLVRQELQRQASFYRSSQNTEAREAVQKRFGCDMWVPVEYMLVKDSADFVWAVNDKGSLRRDLIIYTYPYTDPETFTQTYLLHKRDSILGSRVAGELEGSYMGTEYKHIVPQFNPIAFPLDSGTVYAAELRGLWKMYNGAAMGGPFVQITRLDELHNQVITAEVFIFAPGQKKRNPLRQAEAILYTLRLPEDLMAK